MRVWLAPSAFWPAHGGVEELTLQLAHSLQRLGNEVLVVTNRHPPSLPAREAVEGIAVERLALDAPRARPRQAARFLLTRPALQRQLDAIAPPVPDLVHIQCPSTQTAPLRRYCARHRVPLVLTSQGEVVMDANQIYQHSLYMRLTLRRAARSAAALTACSAWTAQACVPYAARFASATVIPNGVDPRQWDAGALPEEPVLCAWGRHVRQKGLDLAIEAFALLRFRVPEARLLIGGDGPETARLRALAGDGVEFLGAIDRGGVRAMLSRSRVAVVPSRVEPFGIVALEALAAGRGLVYAAGTGLAEAAGAVGRAVDVADAAALAAAMEAELAAPTPRDAGRARARELSWGVIGERYAELYEAVTGREAAADRTRSTPPS
jgi:glycosyltransferase involved in cell wall biosynthesis